MAYPRDTSANRTIAYSGAYGAIVCLRGRPTREGKMLDEQVRTGCEDAPPCHGHTAAMRAPRSHPPARVPTFQPRSPPARERVLPPPSAGAHLPSRPEFVTLVPSRLALA